MNQFKNEHELEIAGKKILLRPDFEALANVESFVGALAWITWKMTVGNKIPKEMLKTTDVAKIIYFCQAAEEGKGRLTLEEIWELMQEDGALLVYSNVIPFMSKMTAGNKNATEMSEGSKKNL